MSSVDPQTLRELAELFKVSPEELTRMMKPINGKLPDGLRERARVPNLTRTHAAALLGASVGTLSHWWNTRGHPLACINTSDGPRYALADLLAFARRYQARGAIARAYQR